MRGHSIYKQVEITLRVMTSLLNPYWAHAGSMICAQAFSSRTYPYAAETVATKSQRRSKLSQLSTRSPPQAVHLDAVRSADAEERHEAIDSVSYTADVASAAEKAPHVPVLLQQVRAGASSDEAACCEKRGFNGGHIAASLLSQVTITLSCRC